MHVWQQENYLQEDGNDVRDVQRHCGEGEDRVGRSRAGEVKKDRQHAEERRGPYGVEGCLCPLAHASQISTIREACKTLERRDERRCIAAHHDHG